MIEDLLKSVLEACDHRADADEVINLLENADLGWSIDHTGIMIEARIWQWPHVVGRYRPGRVEPLREMLIEAIKAGVESVP